MQKGVYPVDPCRASTLTLLGMHLLITAGQGRVVFISSDVTQTEFTEVSSHICQTCPFLFGEANIGYAVHFMCFPFTINGDQIFHKTETSKKQVNTFP